MQSLARQFGLSGIQLSDTCQIFLLEIIMATRTQTIRASVLNICRAGDTIQRECLALRPLFVGASLDAVKAELLPIVAEHFGCTLKVQGSGRTVLQGDKTRVNTATQALKRIALAICADAKPEAEELEVPAELLAAAAKLWKLASQYEQAGKLAAKALAIAKSA